MIFVAVGTQKFQLNRLLVTLDCLVENGKITEEVFAQTGHSDYCPQFYKFRKFLDKDEFSEMIGKADLLIVHSGVGTIITGLKNKKPVVVFPRKVEYGEHVDNHQLEIAEAFAEKNLVLLCNDEKQLLEAINTAREYTFGVYTSGQHQILNRIKRFLTVD